MKSAQLPTSFFRSSDLKDLVRINCGSLKWTFLVEKDDDDDDNDGGRNNNNDNNTNNNDNLGSFFGKDRQYNTQRGRKTIDCCGVVLCCPCIMLILYFLKSN